MDGGLCFKEENVPGQKGSLKSNEATRTDKHRHFDNVIFSWFGLEIFLKLWKVVKQIMNGVR